MKAKAEIREIEGKRHLVIDAIDGSQQKGVDLVLTEDGDKDAASVELVCDMLITSLAGISKGELVSAGLSRLASG